MLKPHILIVQVFKSKIWILHFDFSQLSSLVDGSKYKKIFFKDSVQCSIPFLYPSFKFCFGNTKCCTGTYAQYKMSLSYDGNKNSQQKILFEISPVGTMVVDWWSQRSWREWTFWISAVAVGGTVLLWVSWLVQKVMWLELTWQMNR